MDIVGPLEKSSAGHRYILVVSDYATRYPEAFLREPMQGLQDRSDMISNPSSSKDSTVVDKMF